MSEKGDPVIHGERHEIPFFSTWGSVNPLARWSVQPWLNYIMWEGEWLWWRPRLPKPCGRCAALHHTGDIQSKTANPLCLGARLLKAAPYLAGQNHHLRICFVRSLHISWVLKFWPLLLQKNLDPPGAYRGTGLLLSQDKAAIRVEFWKKQLK